MKENESRSELSLLLSNIFFLMKINKKKDNFLMWKGKLSPQEEKKTNFLDKNRPRNRSFDLCSSSRNFFIHPKSCVGVRVFHRINQKPLWRISWNLFHSKSNSNPNRWPSCQKLALLKLLLVSWCLNFIVKGRFEQTFGKLFGKISLTRRSKK